MNYWPWLSLLASLLLLLQACRVLIADARSGYEISMGADGLFSGHWLLAALAAAAALWMWQVGWGWAMLLFVLLYAGKLPVRALIVALWLGRDLPANAAPAGFKEFLRRAEAARTSKDDSK